MPSWPVTLGGTTGDAAVVGTEQTFSVVFDGGGDVIESAVVILFRIPYACTLTGIHFNEAFGTTSTFTVSVHRATSAAPTVFTQISPATDPGLSNAVSASDTSLGDWVDVTIDEGDWIKLVVETASAALQVGVALDVTRT